MRADLVIGIDCSTTSCKAIIWNPIGKRIAEGRGKLTTFAPKPLWYEQSADTWWNATVSALKDALQNINPNRLAAICISAQRETFVPIDKTYTPLRNAILWMDERAGVQLNYLDQVFGKENFHKLTGKHLSGNLSVAKIVWLQKYEPDVFKKAIKYLDVHAFLTYKLTGRFCTSWGCADPMGLFDMTQNQWALDLLQSMNLTIDQFPDSIPSGHVIGSVTSKASKECGLQSGLPVIAGIGDGQAVGLGTKIIRSKKAYISLGTSIVSGHFGSNYRVSEKFRTMYGGIENTYLYETVILGGAYTISWFLEKVLSTQARKLRNQENVEEYLEGLARKVPAGAQGLMLIPYWNSAMNPYWDEKASGMIVGIRGIHGIGHIYRAILEGIAFELRLHTSGVECVLGNKVNNFIAVGGGANSDLWCQIIADITGKLVQRTLEKEASALGAGILAAYGSGIFATTEDAVESMVHFSEDVFTTDEGRHQFYSNLYECVYCHIFPIMQEKLGILSDLSQNTPSY